MLFEIHHYDDPDFKILYHSQRLTQGRRTVWLHAHPSPEFIYIHEGEILVTCNGVEQVYSANEIVIINGNDMHRIKPLSESAFYDYLIVDLSICDIGHLPSRSTNLKAIELFQSIMQELRQKEPHYKEIVKGYIKVFQALLMRHADEHAEREIDARKYNYLRSATNYMYQHFAENITLDDISAAIPLNKYYLSHLFKDLTGHSVLSNLNYIRCHNAYAMLTTGKYSVSECAYASGFSDSSHFTKSYRKVFSRTPAQDLPKKVSKKN